MEGKWDSIAMSRGSLFSLLGHETAGGIRLPNVAHCAVHLELLNAFVILRAKVMRWGQSCDCDPESSWQAFVKLATARFNIWIHSASRSEMASSLPPLDVVLVWHSFMLNPGSYIKFCKTLRQDGLPSEGISWVCVHQSIDVESGDFTLSPADRTKAESHGIHGDLLEFLENGISPKSFVKELMSSQWKSSDGQGVNKGQSSLRIRNWNFASKDAKEQLLIRTFREMDDANFTYEKASFKFDLPAAVHRQARFAEKMSNFGWLQSPTLGFTICRAVERYDKFFSLIAEFPAAMVPTLDVDLVWHTHQLSPARYIAFCKAMSNGRFIDHDDTIEDGEVHNGFQQIQELYRNQFSEEYVVCHSWYCEASRVDLAAGLSDSDRIKLKSLIEQSVNVLAGEPEMPGTPTKCEPVVLAIVVLVAAATVTAIAVALAAATAVLAASASKSSGMG